MLQKLDNILERISEFFAGIAFVIMVLMAVHISASIVLRWITGHGIPVTIEVAQYYYMVSLTYLPLALIERRGKHLNAEFLYLMLPKLVQILLDIALQLMLLGYIGFLTWRTYLNALGRTRAEETILTTEGNFMTWPARWIVPVCLGLVFLYLVVKILRSLMPTPKNNTPNMVGS